MLRVLCHVFPCFIPFFFFLFQVDDQGYFLTCLYSAAGYALLRSMCLCAFCHVLYLDPYPYMSICLDPCSTCLCTKFLYVYMHVSIPICLHLCFHMPMCMDLRSLHAFFYIPCACALHAMFVCLDLGYVCHAMWYCSPFVALSFFLIFWHIGSNPIQTLWSFSLSIPLGPHQRVWIIFICKSMLACFYALCLCQPLLFQALSCLKPSTGLQLCGYIRRPRGLVWM